MRFPLRLFLSSVLSAALLASAPARSADLVMSVEEAYAIHGLPHREFDGRVAQNIDPDEGRFLVDLFELADEAVLLNTNVVLWFSTRGAKGLHAADYAERMVELREAIDRLETPAQTEIIRDYLSESLRLQQDFLAEWEQANEVGRPFASQLNDEYAYHEGLHRSQRLLLKAFAELRGLFPDVGDRAHESFRDHLHAMTLK